MLVCESVHSIPLISTFLPYSWVLRTMTICLTKRAVLNTTVLKCCSSTFIRQTPFCASRVNFLSNCSTLLNFVFSLFLLMPVLVASCLPFSSHSRLPHGNFILILWHWLPAAPFQLSLEPPPDSLLLIYNPEQHLPQQSLPCDSSLLSVLPGSFPLPRVDGLCPSLPALHSSCAPPRNSWWGGGNLTGHWKKFCSNTNMFGTKSQSLDKSLVGLIQFPLKSMEVFALTVVGAGSGSGGWWLMFFSL